MCMSRYSSSRPSTPFASASGYRRPTIWNAKTFKFIMIRAETFQILRRKPIQGFDMSFLISNFHTEQMLKHKLVDFVLSKEISEKSLRYHARARTVAKG
ncbi:ARPC p20 [Zopfochytrium polystomum]|nr:ARPC p20 [Zopfochytrium polystomum]